MIKGNNSLKWKIVMSTFKDPFIKSILLSVSACLTLFLLKLMLNLKTNHESALVQSMYLVSNGRTVWSLYMTSVRSWLFWVNAEPQDQSNLKKYPFPNFHTMNISHVKVSQHPSAVGRNEQGLRSGLEQSNSCNTRLTQLFITSSDFNADRVRLTKWFKCTVSIIWS